jgi:hypothetical protein
MPKNEKLHAHTLSILSLALKIHNKVIYSSQIKNSQLKRNKLTILNI